MSKCLSLVHLITVGLLTFGIAAAQSELPQARILNLSVDPEQVLILHLRPGYVSSVRVLEEVWFDSSVTHQFLRDWQIGICTRLLSETKQVRFLHPAPKSARKRRHSITEQCAELLPRMMRVQISLPLPNFRDVVQRMRAQGYELVLVNMRSEFNSLHPYQI
jgi:hypothetical protein